jgi:signal transduction histidine kinase
VADAAESALGESRQAIAALSRRPDEPFEDVVAQVAGRLTARAGVRLRLQIDPGIEFESDRRDQLLNIVQEAVSNGVRHGGAEEVSIAVTNGDKTRLTVTDDGTGFDTGSPNAGFGLTSMRERAESLGGRLEVTSRPGGGTRIRVELP